MAYILAKSEGALVFAATSVSRVGYVTITETVTQDPVRFIARRVRLAAGLLDSMPAFP